MPDAIVDRLAAMDPPLTIVDVGARGGIDDRWTPLLQHARAYAFEADPEECVRLAREHAPHVRFVPLALGASPGVARLHVTAEPACSSLYPPDVELKQRYPALELIEPRGERPVTLDTLDRWAEREGVTDVSYLKLDTQGSELDILRGATRTLRRVCALRAEVEFNAIYRGQPLFADVDTFLRGQGFVLWRLMNLCHYELAGSDGQATLPDTQVYAAGVSDVTGVEFVGRGGRLFWAEAFFVRRELAEGTRPGDADAARAFCVLSTLGFHDLAAVCR